ncbi:phosphonoacetaldehyde hydrolase [Novosphingobium sp.]|uniref:phosphonoacetaldehyde hydrolase n=1 Tax=Novosphingobium sp. TaxID=1874826 RepID=UPI003B5199A1
MTFAVKAVIFDWAGTMVDFGCKAPVNALTQVFAQQGVPISEAEARADMGRAKLDHVTALLHEPGIVARWSAHFGKAPDAHDIERIYALVEPAMVAAAQAAAELIPGAAAAYAALLALGVKVGSGTGYTPEMMAAIRTAAARQGYAPEVVICAGDTPSGRPAPLMTWAALIGLDVWPASAAIKVDDAPVGIAEGRHAGCWTVGIAASGNSVGLDRDEFAALDDATRADRVAAATAELRAEGADFVIDDVSQLLPVVHQIAAAIEAGRKPGETLD